MTLITWDSSLSVGITAFDNHHQHLIEILNELHTAMRAGSGKLVVGELLEQLVDYTKTHFASEESLLYKYKYPAYNAHIQEHAELTQKVVDFVKRYQNGEAALTIEVMTFLKGWLTHHILETDKHYTAFLKAKGEK